MFDKVRDDVLAFMVMLFFCVITSVATVYTTNYMLFGSDMQWDGGKFNLTVNTRVFPDGRNPKIIELPDGSLDFTLKTQAEVAPAK